MPRRIVDAIADVLAPRVCAGCAQEGSWLCGFCASSIPFDANSACGGCGRLSVGGATCNRCRSEFRVDGMLAVASYCVPAVQGVIKTVKYAPARDATGAFRTLVDGFLAHGGRSALAAAVGEQPVIVPVPLHRHRRATRGFNQSRCIADDLAGAYGGRVVEALARTRSTPPQAELPHEARTENIRDAFLCIDSGAVSGRRTLLVDDVVTTGATMGECARVLRTAGAQSIWGFVIARG